MDALSQDGLVDGINAAQPPHRSGSLLKPSENISFPLAFLFVLVRVAFACFFKFFVASLLNESIVNSLSLYYSDLLSRATPPATDCIGALKPVNLC